MTKKVILVTGPPGNGRDAYIQECLPSLERNHKVGRYHVFDDIVEAAKHHSFPNLTRENWYRVNKSTMETIRTEAFDAVASKIAASQNDFEIVSTPATFRINPFGDYRSGRIEGLARHHIDVIKPNLIVVLIDDLLRVRKSMLADPLWKDRTQVTLQQLADWRAESIKLVEQYVQERSPDTQWAILSREHPPNTLVDLVEGKKPIVYVSYHMTSHRSFEDVQRLIAKLSPYFVCIDPNTIKDWEMVEAYDAAQEKPGDSISLKVKYRDGEVQFDDIQIDEIEAAMNTIRSQIVDRDYSLIDNSHAVVVYHRVQTPSYGVFGEITHAVDQVSRPVYVLYVIRKRLSPFFEQAVEKGGFIQGDIPVEEFERYLETNAQVTEEKIKALEDGLVERLRREWKNWPTVPDSIRNA